MTLDLNVPEQRGDLTPKITVFGVGGAGCNAVNNMIQKNLEGAEFVVANTDAQSLSGSSCHNKIQMGERMTEGLGAGARADIGAGAAEESIDSIIEKLSGSHMCFITAGMGGGTGTGAAPIIAQAARELKILTVGVVTKPFLFEGLKRMRQAEEGIDGLQKVVDTLIIIPNQNLFRVANEKTTFTEAFALADDVLYQGVKGVTDLMVRPGLINLDFADVKSVMDEMGKAMMGTGEATGEERAREAAQKAIANPLLDEVSLKGAQGVLINIIGGYDLTLFELDEAANLIREEVDEEANIIVGSTLDPEMESTMRVSVVATGIEADRIARPIPLDSRRPLARHGDDGPSRDVEDRAEAVGQSLGGGNDDFADSGPRREVAEAAASLDGQHGGFDSGDVGDSDSGERVSEVINAEFPSRPDASRSADPDPEIAERLIQAVQNNPTDHEREVHETLERDDQPAAEQGGAEESRPSGILGFITRSRMNGSRGGASGSGDTQAVSGNMPEAEASNIGRDEPVDRGVEIPAFLRRQAN